MSVTERGLEHWRAQQEAQRKVQMKDEPSAPLKGGGGGGTSDDVVPLKDYIDARDDAVESRLSAKLDGLPSKAQMWGMVATVIGGVFAVVIGALSFLAFSGDRFDAGMSISPMLAASQSAQAKVDDKQDAQLEMMDKKLDILINQTR